MKKLLCISLIFASTAGVSFAWDPLEHINGEYEGPLGKPLITRDFSSNPFDGLEEGGNESSDRYISILGTFCATNEGTVGPVEAAELGSPCVVDTSSGHQPGIIVLDPNGNDDPSSE